MSGLNVYRIEPCPRCGNATERHYGQSFIYGRLRFSDSLRCSSCDAAQECCGEQIPEDLRPAFIAAGIWRIRVAADAGTRTNVARAFRELYGMSPREAVTTARDAIAILRTGTEAEMEYEQHRLGQYGVRSIIERLE